MSNPTRDRRQQVATVAVDAASIMRRAAFLRGFNDVRAGRPACFDAYNFNQGNEDRKDLVNASWDYERGRQFATIAPVSMPLRRRGKLNRAALFLYLMANIP
jgi:hypothetical protein